MAYVYAESGPQYRIEGLPAGTYSICGAVAQDKAPMVTFELADGQTRRLDIDTSQWPAEQAGLLFVQVIGTGRYPHHHLAGLARGQRPEDRLCADLRRGTYIHGPAWCV